MKCGARVALGVAGGYFLGRTKKMKLALMFAGMAAGRKAGGPGELLKGGSKLLNSSPELAQLTDAVRGRLLEAGKGAALAVATRQVESLTDRVGKRVESLGDLGAPRRGPADDEPPPADDRAAETAEDEDVGVVDDVPPADEPAERAGVDADDADTDEEPAPARRRASAQAKAPSGRGGKSPATTATARRAGAAAGGGVRAAGKTATGTTGKTASGRKPGRATRPRRGEGNG